jgi:mono/diheme cytochrome c family protein
LLPIVLGLLLLPGCRDEYPVELEYYFSPYPEKVTKGGQEVREDFLIAPEDQADLAEELREFFGTPRSPLLAVDPQLQKQLLVPELLIVESWAETPEGVLAHGSSLYRRLCLHCHGLVGDGNGPTAQFLTPRPRDFRQGKFKFRSTARQEVSSSDPKKVTYLPGLMDTAPSREDLKKTLRSGIPTASMPSFNLVDDADLDAIVSYVIHLSLRGKAEYQRARYNRKVATTVPRVAKEWLADANSTYVPEMPAQGWEGIHRAGIASNFDRGRKVYLSDGGCVECHGKDGRASVTESPINATRRNDWGDLNAPRDLTLGWFRGGSRPLDVFYRIKLGIAGSGMPAANDQKVRDEDIWYLVDYVMNLPQQKP